MTWVDPMPGSSSHCRIASLLGSPLVLGLLTIAVSACTDTVYKDRPPFNPPPDANSGFLGYFTTPSSKTTCGNCHVGQQADWIQTRHATAWATLQADPAADPPAKVATR
jgi:hypothetical protein